MKDFVKKCMLLMICAGFMLSAVSAVSCAETYAGSANVADKVYLWSKNGTFSSFTANGGKSKVTSAVTVNAKHYANLMTCRQRKSDGFNEFSYLANKSFTTRGTIIAPVDRIRMTGKYQFYHEANIYYGPQKNSGVGNKFVFMGVQ